jgi:hypothetical protein
MFFLTIGNKFMFTFIVALILLIQTSTISTTADSLRAIDATWNELRLSANVAALDKLLADDWLLTHSDGRVQNKQEYLNELRTGSRSNQKITNDSVVVRLYSNSAVVTGISVQSGISNGQPWQGRFRFTRIWVQRNGAWIMAGSHSSRIVEGK